MYGTDGSGMSGTDSLQATSLTANKGNRGIFVGSVAAVVLFVCSCLAVSVVVVDKSYFQNSYISLESSSSGAVSPVAFISGISASRQLGLYRIIYGKLNYFEAEASETLNYNFLDSYDTLIEPYSSMYLFVNDFDDSSTETYFEYSVCETAVTKLCHNGYLSNFAKGDKKTKPVKINCKAFDTYTITATEIWSSNSTTRRTMSGNAVCMYVRRELRSLSGPDLENLMDAMYTLWNVSEDDGQALYGATYHASSYFAAAHHFNAAWQDGDHIHEGLGFLTQHTKLSNMFEKSMQAVDPSVSLPYWDYTIESAAGLTLFDSFAFTENTFGSLTPPVNHTVGWTYRDDPIENAAIADGRWAKIKVDMNTRYPALESNFGYMRAPWNVNPSPYVSRFSAYTTQLPSCTSFYSWLQVDAMTDFLIASPYGPHASAHGAIGSVYGCDVMDPLREAGLIVSFDMQISLCQKWGFMIKELYRKNYITPQTGCTYTDLDPTDGAIDSVTCGFTCNMDMYDKMQMMLKNLISSKYVGSLSDSQWDDFKQFICYGDSYKLFVGDHVESASPADPSFWPMHPTLDRTLQAKFMSGGFNSETWPTNAQQDYVCDKANCYENGVQSYYTECCYGHYGDSQLLDFVNGDKNAGFGDTNIATMTATDPTSAEYSMPYIYDGFTWDHCDEDFDSLLTSLKLKMHSSLLFNSFRHNN